MKVVISPEYYGTTQHSLESPNFVVLGGNENYCCKVTQLYSRVKNGAFSYIYVDWKTAELAKYMENCWIATKVTFCNEFADIAKAFGIQYERLDSALLLMNELIHHILMYIQSSPIMIHIV